MKSEVHAESLLELEGRSPRTAGKQAPRRARVATSFAKKAAVAMIGAAGVFGYVSRAQAQSCLSVCNASTDQSSASVSGAWGFACVPGFILADDNASGTASVSMTLGANSLHLEQAINSSGCCVAPYANIGIFDGCQASDQWAQPGSHLPIQIGQIAMLKTAWTFQVPLPVKTSEQYRVYWEMFLSTGADGKANGGNLTAIPFSGNFGFDPPTGHAPINGSQGMSVIDYHGQVGQGQGPFVDFLFPAGTYAPDANGVVTVPSVDIKAILDWAVANFPNYYNNNLYLSHLSLAVEAGAFHGTVTTSYASFAVQKTGSPVVYTPPFTASHWTTCSTAADCDDGNACTTDTCTNSQCSNVAVAGCGDAGTSSGSSSVHTSGSSTASSSVHGSGSSTASSSVHGSGSSTASSSVHGSASGGSSVGSSTAGSYSVGGTTQNNPAHTADAGVNEEVPTGGTGGCSTVAAGPRSGTFGTLGLVGLVGLAVIGRRRPRGTRGGSAAR
jgi:MYXO-CTERM domain-containing protein